MATTIQRLFTADELWRMPADGFRYELVHGELRKMSPAGHTHGQIAGELIVSLGQHVKALRLGRVYAAETGFKLAGQPDHVRAPDVAFIRQERLDEAGEVTGFWPGAPDLAIEVLSPGDTYSEVEEKVLDWLAAGTRLVIVVDARRRTATVYSSPTAMTVLGVDDTLDGGDVVPGWQLRVADIFA